MLDRYVSGTVERISAEAPVPVVRVAEERTALGGAANVAAGVTALGAACRLVSVTGSDAEAELIREGLGAHGIGSDDLVVERGRPTTIKTRILAKHQQMLRVDRETTSSIGAATREELAARALGALGWADAVVLEDYDKGVLEPGLAVRLLAEARTRGIPALVDPKRRHFFDYRGAFLVKPNGRELAAALGVERVPRAAEVLRGVAERLACDHLLLTLGEGGMLLLTRDDPAPLAIPSRAREVFDVTGAGDTVTATLAVLLAGGAPVPAAAALANHAAGIEVSRLGAVPVTRGELIAGCPAEETAGVGRRGPASARSRA